MDVNFAINRPLGWLRSELDSFLVFLGSTGLATLDLHQFSLGPARKRAGRTLHVRGKTHNKSAAIH